MNNLLIVGAGIYGIVTYEIAKDIGCFDKIAFVDDSHQAVACQADVIGKCCDIEKLAEEYQNIIVAIGDPKVRLAILDMIEEKTSYKIATLISPKAYVSPSAKIMQGSIIEPMATVHTLCTLHKGCIVSAGAVVNHMAVCEEGVHVDCDAVIYGGCTVPRGTMVECCRIFKG